MEYDEMLSLGEESNNPIIGLSGPHPFAIALNIAGGLSKIIGGGSGESYGQTIAKTRAQIPQYKEARHQAILKINQLRNIDGKPPRSSTLPSKARTLEKEFESQAKRYLGEDDGHKSLPDIAQGGPNARAASKELLSFFKDELNSLASEGRSLESKIQTKQIQQQQIAREQQKKAEQEQLKVIQSQQQSYLSQSNQVQAGFGGNKILIYGMGILAVGSLVWYFIDSSHDTPGMGSIVVK